ncbi:MAG: hypothetical protein LBE31_01825 [Deltaproteobacteria bacterium]|jgi:tetratricopeptide (TPR) repeat protein|nr:hypothetical protein [Deltaproteobacteria bacterium]
MADNSGSNAYQAIKEIEDILNEVSRVSQSIDNKLESDSQKEPVDKLEVDHDFHRHKAKLALLMLEVRDRFEKLTNMCAGSQVPNGYGDLFSRLVLAFSRFSSVDESNHIFETGSPLLTIDQSAVFLAEAVGILVESYLDADRYDEAASLFSKWLPLSHHEESVFLMVQVAFELISRLAVVSKMSVAREIYDSMEGLGGGRADLVLVHLQEGISSKSSQTAKAQRALAPITEPNLNLVTKPSSPNRDKAIKNPKSFQEDDFVCVVRAQTAVNLISGYTIVDSIDEATEIFYSMPVPKAVEDYVNFRSMAAVNLISAHVRRFHWNEGKALFHELQRLGEMADNSIYQAIALVEITGYTEEDWFFEVVKLYESLEGLSDSSEFALQRMHAAGNLVFAAGEFDHIDLARQIYDTLPSFGDSDEAIMVFASATVNLLTDYCASAMVLNAEELFKDLQSFRQLPVVIEAEAQSCYNLMCLYIRLRNFKKAQQYYQLLGTYIQTPVISTWLAHATSGMTCELLKIDRLEEAINTYSNFDSILSSEQVLTEQASAMFIVVNYLCEAGLRTKASNFYRSFLEKYDSFRSNPPKVTSKEGSQSEEAAKFESYLEINGGVFGRVYRHEVSKGPKKTVDSINDSITQAACLLSVYFGQVMLFKEARAFYSSVQKFVHKEQDRNAAIWALSASFELVANLLEAGKVSEAIEIFDDYQSYRISPKFDNLVDRQIAETGIFIINNTWNLSKIKYIFEAMLANRTQINHSSLLCKASRKYIHLLQQADKLRQAREVYDKVSGAIGLTRRNNTWRVEMALLLLGAYQKVGDLENAKSLMKTLQNVGQNRYILKLRDKAAQIYEQIENPPKPKGRGV